MSWLAIADQTGGKVLSRKDQETSQPSARYTALRRGSLMVEARFPTDSIPRPLVTLSGRADKEVELTLHSLPSGGIALVMARGGKLFHIVQQHEMSGVCDTLRITYSWDLDKSTGRITVERPELGEVFSTIIKNPMPLCPFDVQELTLNRARRYFAPELVFCAISDAIEPVGPMPGLAASVPVLTSDGFVPAGKLRRGDLVQTLEKELVPVLHMVRRTVPAKGLFEPIRMRHPYFGLRRDIAVAPTQRLVIGGSRVEYLFGAEHVLAPARHLVNGTAAVREVGHELVTYVQIILPDHHAIMAAGTYLESLDIGPARRSRDLHSASLLSGFDFSRMPHHSKTAYPVLGAFDAVTLADLRAA